MLRDPSPRRRWPRSQRFALTDKGRDAEASYRSSIVSSRSQEGRASFDAARSTWAESFRLLSFARTSFQRDSLTFRIGQGSFSFPCFHS